MESMSSEDNPRHTEDLTGSESPLEHVDDWEHDLLRRYPNPTTNETTANQITLMPESEIPSSNKPMESFRDYAAETRPSVKDFYRINHAKQTYSFVQSKRKEYLGLNQKVMGIWEAMEYLDTLIDDSDPDTDLSQIEHLLQTSEAIRNDGHPDWFILTGLIHDLGKILCLMGEPQWAVVGDTFPVGCRYAPSIVYHDFFTLNPDWNHPVYSTILGVYEKNIGLDQVLMSWGHDEYLYHVVKDFLPQEALYMIRYHSFYAAHRENEYRILFNEQDDRYFHWVQRFNQYDLYSKSDQRPNVKELRPYYESLIANYFPATLSW